MAALNFSAAGTDSAISFIDPASLMQIQSLDLRAKAVMEGMISGLHRSPYHGFSVEFTEYREYVSGDDLRYLDWRLYARSDRFYIKRFEDETNLKCHLLLDNSMSMSYGSISYSKAEYGKTLAGTIAYFLTQQRDAVGLFRFSSTLDEYIPPRYRSGHLRRILASLEEQPAGTSTGLVQALEQVAERVRRRSLFVLISDILTPLDALESRLRYLRAAGSEVAIFQILDPAELTFPFEDAATFVDSETGREVYVDPKLARQSYQQKLQSHLDAVARCCEESGISLHRVSTETPLEQVLFDFLKTRMRVSQTRRRS
ncbi:DUF58 domain-containing protein [Planctomicrobium sp. SH661]|uniref:DUF58 domain-containing protein n=1 Tax=Planctomicrobium sp. SH661 TaxID=3448124 RepID=UPI003F5B59BE